MEGYPLVVVVDPGRGPEVVVGHGSQISGDTLCFRPRRLGAWLGAWLLDQLLLLLLLLLSLSVLLPPAAIYEFCPSVSTNRDM